MSSTVDMDKLYDGMEESIVDQAILSLQSEIRALTLAIATKQKILDKKRNSLKKYESGDWL